MWRHSATLSRKGIPRGEHAPQRAINALTSLLSLKVANKRSPMTVQTRLGSCPSYRGLLGLSTIYGLNICEFLRDTVGWHDQERERNPRHVPSGRVMPGCQRPAALSFVARINLEDLRLFARWHARRSCPLNRSLSLTFSLPLRYSLLSVSNSDDSHRPRLCLPPCAGRDCSPCYT